MAFTQWRKWSFWVYFVWPVFLFLAFLLLAILFGISVNKGWPKRQKLIIAGVFAVNVDIASRTLKLFIPRASTFDPDQFGFLFHSEGLPNFRVLHENAYRIWKISGKIYFFEEW